MSGRCLLRARPLERLAAAAASRTTITLSSFTTAAPISRRCASTATVTSKRLAPTSKASGTPALTRRERRPHPPKKSIATPRPSDKTRGPFFVNRTASNQLPVYQDKKSAQPWLTLIRKIDGDAHTLRDELVELLGTPEIEVRGVTNHIWVKGQHKTAIVDYLQSKGF
ncbi:hypothetical protein MCOR27_005850 [Pyricularia oryzae]|uniref:Large ribosomal subunit protein mL49 n=3 Tax=Pyricularia TaxID=48558 RepID=A0ABQ8P1I3_PYRGI|nr:uncharacterized protein MGG_03318 [Pyricularia oryzae 70-15]KAH8843933.1 hypothetical protein MCOR01_004712 [Pyricularia oryzae]KAI6304981.1 hypothetical protein MCOR33_000100 [Pyricularia grisea]EHA50322.1 hypothetical protein MGG_03318 [Pyricularia oryzae 70-15]KAH9431414.1 hypothetical protein MCOR02_008706 [Pyricularia oryzae]KAI6256163.1 hypothetical protein MCOR19_007336 [Pyricularia oryzae]